MMNKVSNPRFSELALYMEEGVTRQVLSHLLILYVAFMITDASLVSDALVCHHINLN